MKGKHIQNLAASVYARLLKPTEPGDEQFQFVLMRYGAERLMYRLSQSEHAANFVLKGAMMFLVWTGAQYRATKDMDSLALKSASVERLRDIFRELCELPVAQDGLVFEPDSVKAEEGRFNAKLGSGSSLRRAVGRFQPSSRTPARLASSPS